MLKSCQLRISIITCSLIASTLLSSNQSFVNPLGSAFKSTDNGGTLHAIDAYKDGVGVIVLDNLGAGIQVDNSAMNTLVFKYGEEAKINNTTIIDEVLYGSGTSNIKDKVLVGKLTVDTTSCNDGNPATLGETWLNGVCQGGVTGNLSTSGTIYANCSSDRLLYAEAYQFCNIRGMRLPSLSETIPGGGTIPSCSDRTWTSTEVIGKGIPTHYDYSGEHTVLDSFDTIQNCFVRCVSDNNFNGAIIEGAQCTDGNFLTIQDKYINGICTGTLTANGQSCNDGNVLSINDIYTDGVCAGTLTVNGATCDDGHILTVNDKWLNGVCTGTLTVNGATCDDGIVTTYGDKWLNGICAGFTNGTTCSDGNSATYADKYTNGVCAGIVNGTTCNDGNAATYADIYTNGICAGFTNGTTCSDGNAATYADIYTNGVCAGYTNGTLCNDGNALTYADKYTNGICAGVTNGSACNDGNAATYADKYTNGVCAGVTNGTVCNDGNAATTGETYLNGVCQGGLIGVNTTVSGLLYDNCEGGSKVYADAITYCSSKGMRLPTITESIHRTSGGVPACSNWTWTSTFNNEPADYRDLFSDGGISYHNDGPSVPRMVRCVK